MLKIIEIGEKEVLLEVTGGTPIRYRKQFGTDYFGDLIRLMKSMSNEKEKKGTEKTVDISEISWENLNHLEFETVYNIVWTLAKTADKTIGEPLEWFDSFDCFPIDEILPEITDLIFASLQSKKNSKAPMPVKNH